MFGIKNSATPYVRTGGVDRQTILTSDANGNAPVREIGVNANGNLVFSTDGETFKSVLDLKYSEFVTNDENQSDDWKTEKAISMLASGTLDDGTTKKTGVIVSPEYSAMVSASTKDDTSSVSQIATSSDNVSIYSSDGSNDGYLNVTPSGVQVIGKLSLANSTIQEDGTSQVDEWDSSTGVQMHTKSTTHENKILAGTGGIGIVSGDLSGSSSEPIVTTIGVVGSETTLQSRNGNTIRTVKFTPNGTTINGNEVAVTTDIPTKVSQLLNDSNFVTNAVDNLTNYYLKKDTYTKDEVNSLIANLKSVSFEIVDTLPTTGSSNVIYLVPHSHGTQDTYDEYIYVNDAWEKIGNTDIDLSGYAKTTDLDAYLPLAGGQLTGALKIARGYDKGIQTDAGDNILYVDKLDHIYLLSKTSGDIHIGSDSDIYLGGTAILGTISVKGASFKYNDKSVAVTDDIPKTLNNKTLVANGDTTIYGTDITLASDNVGNLTDAIIGANIRIDNLTTTVNGKADTSAIPTKTSQLTNDSGYINKDVSNLTNYLPLSGGTLTGTPMVKDNTILTFVNSEGTPFYLLSYSDALKCFEIGNYGVPVHLIGSETRPKYETPTTEDGGVDLALLSDVPSVEQSTGSSTTATMSQKAITTALNDKVSASTENTFLSPQTFSAGTTFNNGIALANDTLIFNGSGDSIIATTYEVTTFGNGNSITNIQGSADRPTYNGNNLALYTDTTSKLSTTDIVQTTGTNTDKVMSQNATTTELDKKANLSGGNVFTGTQKMNNALAVSSILTNGAGNTMYIGTGNAGLKYYNINNTSNMWNVVVDSDGNLIFQKG